MYVQIVVSFFYFPAQKPPNSMRSEYLIVRRYILLIATLLFTIITTYQNMTHNLFAGEYKHIGLFNNIQGYILYLTK